MPAGSDTGVTHSVTGPDDEIERNAPGGWAQARYQRRAEDSWHHNAVAVADVAIRVLDQVKADLLLLAGDVRAVQLLRDHLDRHVRGELYVRLVPGGRSPDGSTRAHQQAITAAVAVYANTRSTALLDHSMSGAIEDVVEGTAATLAALAEGRLQMLFVPDDPLDQRRAWFGPDRLCAELVGADTDSAMVTGRLADVAVRAALLTNPDIKVITPVQAKAFDDQIGGICRYTAVT